ncbi:hypothetical protein METBIDRAFT_35480 [Metschnikowia bicuspidata var. bicuspidata NRRL YB-4993]|uniref:NADH dehydrogenase [ubiquinone] 1 alpha subcomplex assembly factor 3 n=1 Tax=Metschnikowia bicuspidata var. bicuspidata NRRL YB-4993 TaxID=869754 RepID=A0A1A0HIL1_9ASCO|nr:hypothetical protein METBIDRAFT_35480 [Metschnikowia bicuspidata var. bicuspidata NRRL YB-4993]OBA23841.1 hypothetical protein METBIDRAFT_35480 [Metschnikowia bicuspidata var. bicuspidata NRRL YB-4993]
MLSSLIKRNVPKRLFSISRAHNDLFGGGKTINQGKHMMAPGNKLEAVGNPVDLIKKNDILMYSQKPINYIESVKPNGFHLANNMLITSPSEKGDVIGALLLESESFEVNFSNGGYKMVNGFIVEFSEELILSLFCKVHPKPEILVVGLGKKSRMLLEKNRQFLSGLGIQLELGELRHAARIYDLLATERPGVISALLLPPNA